MGNLDMPWTIDYDARIMNLFEPKCIDKELHDSQEPEEHQTRKFFRHY